MVEELSQYYTECEMEVVSVENVTLPAKKEGMHSILVLPSDNLAEMLEEASDEAGSLSAYVHQQLAEVHELSVEEVMRQIVASQLEYTDIPSEHRNLEEKDFEDIYQAYALLWEGSELLNEQLCEGEHEPFLLNVSWVQEHMEDTDDLLVLSLPLQAGYEAPLWVPMGGFNECPLPVYQSVMMKHFQEKYEVTILAVTDDTWIVQAGRRPATEEEALRLAKEHFIFCQYILEGYPTLGHYADYLMKHDTWYFWWD